MFVFLIMFYFVYQLAEEKSAIHRDFSKLKEIEHIKSDFISVASNRLRTPLTGTLYALTELSEGKLDDIKRMEITKGGLESAKTAVSVVNDLIQAIELDAYHLKLYPEVVNIPRIIKEIQKVLDYSIKKNNIDFVIDMPNTLTIKANPRMIQQAIESIVENALSYSPNGKVEITVKEIGKACEILVKDTGIGISEDELPLIFERLHRGKEAVRLEPNRSGIGMYTVKRIIDMHKGTIEVFSKSGAGTAVRITLPV